MPFSALRPLPVTSRYVVRQFLSLFVPILATFVLLYVLVDLFDRLDILLRHDATLGASTRYFLFKIPLMVTQVTPPAVITAVLLGFGLLARYNEISAFRASGISLFQTAAPVVLTAAGISCAALIWNETIVPYCSQQFQLINNLEIRKRELRGVLSDRHIWFHGAAGFYHIDHVNKAEQTIYGLLIYRLDDAFMLQSVVEIPKAKWRDGQWHLSQAIERQLGADSPVARTLELTDIGISETLDDFLAVQRAPEELSFLVLREWIRDLTQKGIDASEYLVDLHLKLALPFASLVLAMVGASIGGRVRRHPSLAAIIGLGLAVGFAYWVVFGFASSFGRNGVLPPIVAAWAANLVFALTGAALFLYGE
jgi:lipopolysaccharide export system permease protein